MKSIGNQLIALLFGSTCSPLSFKDILVATEASLWTINNSREFNNLVCLHSAFCVCILHSAFCVLKLCSQILWFFFNKIIILTKNLNLSFILFTYRGQKTYLFKPKHPFKLHQNPVTQSNLKLQRETHYAVSGTLMQCRVPQRCKCWVLLFLRPKEDNMPCK